MKFAFKSIVAAAAFVVAGAASAANVTVAVGGTYNDLKLESGSGALSFSTALIGALNASGTVVSAVAPATPSITTTSKGAYKTISVSAPFVSLVADTTTNSVVAALTSGGALQTTEDDGFTNTGGSLSITNINADLTAKKIYVTLTGANGVGTLNNFYLWDIGSISGSTALAAGTTITSLSGLSITTDGFNKFSQALGLTTAGKNALATVTDFGAITSTVVASKVPAIPEPSTYALMGLGLVGISLVARRRAK